MPCHAIVVLDKHNHTHASNPDTLQERNDKEKDGLYTMTTW